MLVDVTKEERDVLLRWKKRSDSFVLVRLKAEAVLYASRDVDVSIIAEMLTGAGERFGTGRRAGGQPDCARW